MNMSPDYGPSVCLSSDTCASSDSYRGSVGSQSFSSSCRDDFYDPPAIVKTILSVLFKEDKCLMSIIGLNTRGEFEYILECTSIEYEIKNPHIEDVIQSIINMVNAQYINDRHILQVFLSFSPKTTSIITKEMILSDIGGIFKFKKSQSQVLVFDKFMSYFTIRGIKISIKAFVEMKLITLLLVNDNLHNYTIKSQILHTIILYDIKQSTFDSIELIFHPRVACLIHKKIRFFYESGDVYILGAINVNPVMSMIFYKNLLISKLTGKKSNVETFKTELYENDLGITILNEHPYIVEIAKFACIQSFMHPKKMLYPVNLYIVDSGKYLTSDKIDEYGIDSVIVQNFLKGYNNLLKNVDSEFFVPSISEVKGMFEVVERVARNV